MLRDYQQQAVNRVIEYIKKNTQPALLELSTGAGKSHIIAELAKWAKTLQRDVIVISDTKEIIEQDYLKFTDLGYDAAIYSASLNKKETTGNVTFCSVQTLVRNLDQFNRKISLIIIDEAHKLSTDESSSYQKVLTHFYNIFSNTRVIGLTATPYRLKDGAIYGHDKFFKKLLYRIKMERLVEKGYLTPFEYYDESENYHFSDVKQTGGKFNASQLDAEITKKEKLTERIIKKVVHESNKRNGTTLIFASTIKHAQRILTSLPEHESALITGNTPIVKRDKIISSLRTGNIKYIVNVAVLLVGFDCANISVIAMLRPTESISLFIQALGRGCRIDENKKTCLIMDFAGNFSRHGDVDDPVILDVIKKKNYACDLKIPCPQCNTENGLFVRRCIGVVDNKRCDYFFEANECPKCETLNDISSRKCRNCDYELIDPDKKLTARSFGNSTKIVKVNSMRLWFQNNGLSVVYSTTCGKTFKERFWPNSKNIVAQRIYTNKFLKEHKKNTVHSHFYKCGSIDISSLISNIKLFNTPKLIHYYNDPNTGVDKITRKVFN